MGTVVLDASVLLGFLNPNDVLGDGCRTAIAEVRLRGDGFTLPASALAESLVHTARDRPDRLDDLIARIVGLFGGERVVDRHVAKAAAQLRAGHPTIRLPDALVIATGVVDDAVVLTCDKRLAGVDPRVQVLGP